MAYIFITKEKTNWKYLLIIFILGIIIGAGTLWLASKQRVSPVELPEIKKQEKVEDETANWKTYRNEEYGYEVKYPENYAIEEEIIKPLTEQEIEQLDYCYKLFNEVSKPFKLLSKIRIRPPKEITFDRAEVDINIYNNSNNLLLTKWLDFWNDPLAGQCEYLDVKRPIFNREVVSINGIEGIKGFSGCCGGCEKGIYFSDNKIVYNLLLLGGNPGEGCEPCCFRGEESIFNQMLSTFTLY